ncbi:MAG: CAP domain-containing protein [Flavobacteriales bacterium]|nr:CAP domain-containing protein [Flavobacteriales bacterium]
MKLLFLSATLLLSSVLIAQEDWTEGWSASVIKQAKVSGSVKMNQTEKDVVFYCNLVRLDPKLFLKTILPKYIASRELKNTGYISSLKRDLKKTKKMEVLSLSDKLYGVAHGHAVTSGKKGTTGHQNYSKRFKAVSSTFSSNGENCDYGNAKAIDIFFSWLIDKGISSLGHRKNILDKEFNHAAVSIAEHKKYDTNAVMTLGKK